MAHKIEIPQAVQEKWHGQTMPDTSVVAALETHQGSDYHLDAAVPQGARVKLAECVAGLHVVYEGRQATIVTAPPTFRHKVQIMQDNTMLSVWPTALYHTRDTRFNRLDAPETCSRCAGTRRVWVGGFRSGYRPCPLCTPYQTCPECHDVGHVWVGGEATGADVTCRTCGGWGGRHTTKKVTMATVKAALDAYGCYPYGHATFAEGYEVFNHQVEGLIVQHWYGTMEHMQEMLDTYVVACYASGLCAYVQGINVVVW